MNRKCFIPLLAAAALVACNKTDVTAPDLSAGEQKGDVALNFGAYINRTLNTKSGKPGEISSNNDLERFGVFAYYGNGELYNEMLRPDFMYNQEIYRNDDSKWVYDPVRYWPNEFGDAAESEDVDRLSFFAYAPWVMVNPATGVVVENHRHEVPTGDLLGEYNKEYGIIALSRNTATGDPFVKYAASLTPEQCVDLMWGVAHEDTDLTYVMGSEPDDWTANEPFIDIRKPNSDGTVKFSFKHALAALNVQIDTDIDTDSDTYENDEDNHSDDDSIADFTHVFVRSVTFEGFTLKGALNLNSKWDDSTDEGRNPIWSDLASTGILNTDAITVHDGRRDGKEGFANATAKNEGISDLNPRIIQSKPYKVSGGTLEDDYKYTNVEVMIANPDPDDDAPEDHPVELGVPSDDYVNLFNSYKADDYVYVIPTGESMKVTIVYDVETPDATLPGLLSDGVTHGTSVENAITHEIKLGGTTEALTLNAGKRYVLKIHLGLQSVKFDAEVEDWVDEDDDSHSWHPIN